MGTYDLQSGSAERGIRSEVVDSIVKQVAIASYKMKQLVSVVPTNAWKNTFYREDTSVSSGPTGGSFKEIPRGANFPHSETSWQEVSVRQIKFGTELNLTFEDVRSSDINIQARNLIRRTQEVTKAVDDYIYDGLTQSHLGTGLISSFAVNTTGHGRWDATSASIVSDLMKASELISLENYDVSDLVCVVHPYEKRSMMTWIADKGAQWQTTANDILLNGAIGKVAGVTIIETPSALTSYALVCKPKMCATLNQLVPLTTETTEDPLKSWRVRIAEIVSFELTDPKAICLISDLRSP